MEITRNQQLRDYISEIMFDEYVVFEGDEHRYSLSDIDDYLAFEDEFYGENVEIWVYAEKCNDKFIEWFKGYNPGAVFENGEFISIKKETK